MNKQMSMFDDLKTPVCTNVPLSGMTSFAIGGPAQFFAEPCSIEELRTLIDRAVNHGLPIHVLGGGTNILVDDAGVPGLVVSTRSLRWSRITDHLLLVGAGYPTPMLVNYAVQNGFAGIESLAGIPGTIGGALRTNAGGKHGCLASILHAVTLVANGHVVTRPASSLGLAYRSSNLGNEIAVELILKTRHGDPAILKRKRDEIVGEKSRKQPLANRSAGCVFKNPEGQAAGKLIDECGLKGLQVGGARISEQHANFIINLGNASSSDVLRLMELVQKTVNDRTGFQLVPEIQRWPEKGES